MGRSPMLNYANAYRKRQPRRRGGRLPALVCRAATPLARSGREEFWGMGA